MDQKTESAYRRGYSHGYAFAIDDVKSGSTLKKMLSHFDKKIMTWRYRKTETVTFPPILKTTKTNKEK